MEGKSLQHKCGNIPQHKTNQQNKKFGISNRLQSTISPGHWVESRGGQTACVHFGRTAKRQRTVVRRTTPKCIYGDLWVGAMTLHNHSKCEKIRSVSILRLKGLEDIRYVSLEASAEGVRRVNWASFNGMSRYLARWPITYIRLHLKNSGALCSTYGEHRAHAGGELRGSSDSDKRFITQLSEACWCRPPPSSGGACSVYAQCHQPAAHERHFRH